MTEYRACCNQDSSQGWFYLSEAQCVKASFGRNGTIPANDKREGDGKTPLGRWKILNLYYRADRITIPNNLSIEAYPIEEDMGWCDDSNHPLYNQAVTLPFEAGHERLYRDDACYDLLLVLDYNLNPIIKGKGSAIFLHIAREVKEAADYAPTEGCVALSKNDLLTMLPFLNHSDYLTIQIDKKDG